MLSLFQSGKSWTGAQLAERLGVTARTVRADVDRLRSLGYPIESTRGRAGTYRLGAGALLPPLLLDDEEAVAVGTGLRLAANVPGFDDAAPRALAKLRQVLPERLRPTIDAVAGTVDSGPGNTDTDAPDPVVDPRTLRAVAHAVREGEWLRFDYRGEPRRVEPYRVLTWQRRWYLVARDPDSGEWDAFRLDWMEPRMPTRRPFTPIPIPGGDFAAFVLRAVASSGWNVHARLRIAAPADAVLARINPAVGVVEAVDATTSVLLTGADSLETIAAYIGMLGMDFVVESPPELVPVLARVAERYLRAARG